MIVNKTDFRLLHRKVGTYALILKCSHQQRVDIGKIGKMNVRKGCYVYVGSAFGNGGLSARIKHHFRVSRSHHWHMDYLRPFVEINEVWYSLDPIKREHQWADIFTRTPGVKLPIKGFGSSDCKCDAHLFFFKNPPSITTFRKRMFLSLTPVPSSGAAGQAERAELEFLVSGGSRKKKPSVYQNNLHLRAKNTFRK